MHYKPQNEDFNQLITINPCIETFNVLLYNMHMYNNLFPKIVIRQEPISIRQHQFLKSIHNFDTTIINDEYEINHIRK